MYAIKVCLLGTFARKTASQPPNIFLSLSIGSFRCIGPFIMCVIITYSVIKFRVDVLKISLYLTSRTVQGVGDRQIGLIFLLIQHLFLQ